MSCEFPGCDKPNEENKVMCWDHRNVRIASAWPMDHHKEGSEDG